MNEKRGIWMAANCAMKEEFTVGWGFHLNKENVVALKNSDGCESLHGEHTLVHPLTTATNEAKTRMNSAFAGGGGI